MKNMGIKYFYSWLKQHYKNCIDQNQPSDIDHVLVDMNGLIHEAAQSIYQYGKYENKYPIAIPLSFTMAEPTIKQVAHHVVKQVNHIVSLCRPCKNVVLAIDGVAPLSKQNQQRQRRFKSVLNNTCTTFDSNSITAGTPWMSQLVSYLTHELPFCLWSTDQEPGEGEHKLMNWIRSNHQQYPYQRYCVVGLDADLILLCLALKAKHVWIMRPKQQPSQRFDIIHIEALKQKLPMPVADFIVCLCLVGNDFLPSLPCLDIKEHVSIKGALDYLCHLYKHQPFNLASQEGYLFPFHLKQLFERIAEREQSIMDARYEEECQHQRYPNSLWRHDIQHYRIDYYTEKFKDKPPKKNIIYAYLKTIQWVLRYYMDGIPSWDWYYPYSFTLFASDFAQDLPFITWFGFQPSEPCSLDNQLLRIIPVQSKTIVPFQLRSRLEQLAQHFTLFKIDLEGKRQEWEATVIVDFIHSNSLTTTTS